MERLTNLDGEPYEVNEYITLDDRFTEVFKRPAVIQLVCEQTNDGIRKTKHWNKGAWKRTGAASGHTMSWFFLTMIDSARKDLHDPNNKNKMSINGHISMARWVLEMVQNKIKHLDECYWNGVVYVRHRQNAWDRSGKVAIIIEPETKIKNQKGGIRILRAEKYGWQKYQKQIEDTIAELLRLRQALADGYCDGDTVADSQPKGGE
jgi:hypothetical protein|tara:strand:+ start:560 stop:1177 length:618 start_codon:yes stop_codon:yes gene_type:complete